jgi:hypothetical protein
MQQRSRTERPVEARPANVKTQQASKGREIIGQETIGIDLGDKMSHYAILSAEGELVEEGRFRNTPGTRKRGQTTLRFLL